MLLVPLLVLYAGVGLMVMVLKNMAALIVSSCDFLSLFLVEYSVPICSLAVPTKRLFPYCARQEEGTVTVTREKLAWIVRDPVGQGVE